MWPFVPDRNTNNAFDLRNLSQETCSDGTVALMQALDSHFVLSA
jgi:hypothetical protein